MVVVVASLPLFFRRKGSQAVAGAWGLGFAFAAFWALPVVIRTLGGFTTDMRWHAVRGIENVFPRELWPMILLAVNCEFGNADCGMLTRSAIDPKGGWINFPRPKTGVNWRCPLWRETVAAVQAALEDRRDPSREDQADKVFLTRTGEPWHRDEAKAPRSPLSAEFRKLIKGIDDKAAEDAR